MDRDSLSKTAFKTAVADGAMENEAAKTISLSTGTLTVEEGVGVSFWGPALQQAGCENWAPQWDGLQHAGFVRVPDAAFAVGPQKPASVTRTVAKAASLRNMM